MHQTINRMIDASKDKGKAVQKMIDSNVVKATKDNIQYLVIKE